MTHPLTENSGEESTGRTTAHPAYPEEAVERRSFDVQTFPRRADEAHSSPLRPHTNPGTESASETRKPITGKPRNWVSAAGQWLAYAGILGLMGGTCLVILGYFRGPASYAPTGWLITMASQMLLFLGVVTLVSNGMEETVQTVSQQINRLDDKLLRIEQATHLLQAPHSLRQFREAKADNVQHSPSRSGTLAD